jgi:hypothetical protein
MMLPGSSTFAANDPGRMTVAEESGNGLLRWWNKTYGQATS